MKYILILLTLLISSLHAEYELYHEYTPATYFGGQTSTNQCQSGVDLQANCMDGKISQEDAVMTDIGACGLADTEERNYLQAYELRYTECTVSTVSTTTGDCPCCEDTNTQITTSNKEALGTTYRNRYCSYECLKDLTDFVIIQGYPPSENCPSNYVGSVGTDSASEYSELKCSCPDMNNLKTLYGKPNVNYIEPEQCLSTEQYSEDLNKCIPICPIGKSYNNITSLCETDTDEQEYILCTQNEDLCLGASEAFCQSFGKQFASSGLLAMPHDFEASCPVSQYPELDSNSPVCHVTCSTIESNVCSFDCETRLEALQDICNVPVLGSCNDTSGICTNDLICSEYKEGSDPESDYDGYDSWDERSCAIFTDGMQWNGTTCECLEGYSPTLSPNFCREGENNDSSTAPTVEQVQDSNKYEDNNIPENTLTAPQYTDNNTTNALADINASLQQLINRDINSTNTLNSTLNNTNNELDEVNTNLMHSKQLLSDLNYSVNSLKTSNLEGLQDVTNAINNQNIILDDTAKSSFETARNTALTANNTAKIAGDTAKIAEELDTSGIDMDTDYTSISNFANNVKTDFDTVTTQFNDTKAILQGDFSLAMANSDTPDLVTTVQGQELRVNLCDTMVIFKPIIYFILSISLMLLAIRIYYAGMLVGSSNG